jgi:transcriptional antiterminator NusG
MMTKQWYVIHTYAGFEGRVKASIRERANQMALVEYVGQVLVPTEDVIEIKGGKRRTSRRKFFPGYVLVELDSPVSEELMLMIKETPKVTTDHHRLKVLVSIFGRSTPVELSFLQVERT